MTAPLPALLLDLDGTLVDSRADLAASTNHVRRQHDLPPVSVEQVESWIGDGAPALVARALDLPVPGDESAPGDGDLPEPLDAAVRAFRAHYAEHCLDATVPYPGVRETLEGLRAGDRRIAVVTNKPESFSIEIVETLELAALVDTVVGGDTAERKKPDPAPVHLALERLGVDDPADAWMVGDGPQDLGAGRAAGCVTVAALWGFRSEQVLKKCHPDHMLARFMDLPGLIARTATSHTAEEDTP